MGHEGTEELLRGDEQTSLLIHGFDQEVTKGRRSVTFVGAHTSFAHPWFGTLWANGLRSFRWGG